MFFVIIMFRNFIQIILNLIFSMMVRPCIGNDAVDVLRAERVVKTYSWRLKMLSQDKVSCIRLMMNFALAEDTTND